MADALNIEQNHVQRRLAEPARHARKPQPMIIANPPTGVMEGLGGHPADQRYVCEGNQRRYSGGGMFSERVVNAPANLSPSSSSLTIKYGRPGANGMGDTASRKPGGDRP